MELLEALCIIGAIHTFLLFIDMFLKSCSHYPYLYFLEKTGLKVGPGRIQWCTTVVNSYFQKIVRYNPNFWRRWFALGVWVTCLMLPVAVYLVASTTVSNLWKKNQLDNHNLSPSLEPMIPGVNLPLGDLNYYLSAIAISSVVHEAGHAFAAQREGVQVSGFGFCIFLILPAAYVLLSSNQVQALPSCRSLRISTAGVWHNTVLSLLAYATVILMPHFVSPFYSQGTGVYVVGFSEDSPLRGSTGFYHGDIIVNVNNNCDVKNKLDWKQCISDTLSENNERLGFCIGINFLLENTSPTAFKDLLADSTNCCPNYKSEHLCFTTTFPEDIVKQVSDLDRTLLKKNCLPARKVIEESGISCRTHTSCPSSKPLCIHPLLANDTHLLAIRRTTEEPNQPKLVIFLGHPAEIWWGVQVSDFIPRFRFISLFASRLPDISLLLMKYIAILSSGLALINMLPIFMFDGQYIITDILLYFLIRFISRDVVEKIAKLLLISCSILFIACLVSYLF
ncbi:membrane-bound transcription factor site-2 protease isoform X2 [Ischnura elegans]|uniref:membrane-bound transcription factor site-2 protease isoform X2 n=1 Tax=Ischnura elegans TaxID=197161 RepID=UPI001ED8B30B|nr:membrane-bound transcription factor site-2 protease isoform X2 [Ischnura elegans]